MRFVAEAAMKAAWIEEFGGLDVIKVGERPTPRRNSGDVLVKMEVSTLNHRDLYLRRGEAGRVLLPVILGSDGAGTVVEVSPDSFFKPGQRVAIYPVLFCGNCIGCLNGQPHKCLTFGMVGGEKDGTHSEYIVVSEQNLVPIPDGLSSEIAAAVSLAGLTAWNMVVDEGFAKPGEHALVLGASGGVGVFVVLLLKYFGLTVYAVTSSPEKKQALYDIGADYVLDDSPLDVLKSTMKLYNKGVDLAFNCVGGESWRYVLPAVRNGGRILICGTVRSPIAELDMRQIFYRNLSLIGCSMGTPEGLIELLNIAATNEGFRLPIDSVISLDDIPRAHERMEAGQLTGKVVIQF